MLLVNQTGFNRETHFNLYFPYPTIWDENLRDPGILPPRFLKDGGKGFMFYWSLELFIQSRQTLAW